MTSSPMPMGDRMEPKEICGGAQADTLPSLSLPSEASCLYASGCNAWDCPAAHGSAYRAWPAGYRHNRQAAVYKGIGVLSQSRRTFSILNSLSSTYSFAALAPTRSAEPPSRLHLRGLRQWAGRQSVGAAGRHALRPC